MDGGIFLTIYDYMKLIGTNSYSTAAKELLTVRTEYIQGKKRTKKRITIQEYCKQEGLDFEYVWEFLRGGKPKTPSS